MKCKFILLFLLNLTYPLILWPCLTEIHTYIFSVHNVSFSLSVFLLLLLLCEYKHFLLLLQLLLLVPCCVLFSFWHDFMKKSFTPTAYSFFFCLFVRKLLLKRHWRGIIKFYTRLNRNKNPLLSVSLCL